jgi:hypothetical protein
VKTHPSKETLGNLWVDDRGTVWKQISYTDQPTASFRRVDDESQRLSGVVGCLLLRELRPLKPEDE